MPHSTRNLWLSNTRRASKELYQEIRGGVRDLGGSGLSSTKGQNPGASYNANGGHRYRFGGGMEDTYIYEDPLNFQERISREVLPLRATSTAVKAEKGVEKYYEIASQRNSIHSVILGLTISEGRD